MSQAQTLLAEFEQEAQTTRKFLERMPDDKLSWRVQQMLIDPEEHNDWVAEFEVSLAASKEEGFPVLRLIKVGALP